MSTTQPDKNLSDLDYLAGLGFEQMNVSDADISELKSKVKSRVFSYNSGAYFGFISLLTGAFLGISVFFIYYNAPHNSPAPKTIAKAEPTEEIKTLAATHLDTISVVAENFIYQPATPKIKSEEKELSPVTTDTAEVLEIKTLQPSVQSPEKLREIEIRYIPNAPVIYLHDLKITNYSSLYFRKNKFITLSVPGGVDPSYANKEDMRRNENILMPADNYYLHEAIGEAMLYFSKKEYNRCLRTLQIVQEINPDDINCRFYSGMCYYYKKNYTAAVKNLDYCIDHANNSFLNEAQYYKALSLYESGNKTEAYSLLRQIVDEGGFYAEKARGFLK
ncbi:MAG: hypothetical protein K0S12_1299 [Bacteroidetes bacterium]|jgi:hypothetical protein|nr:hypothetical protein [Bacteroidota bacterium]